DGDGVWRWSVDRYLEELKNGNIYYKKTTTSSLLNENGEQSKWNIYTKIWLEDRLEEGRVPVDLITKWENRISSQELKDLDLPFDFAKPVELIKYLIDLVQNNDNGIVMDFFSGSATTAHAVMASNVSQGKKKFIMVQIPDECAENSEEFKAGYKTIDEIGRERIRRAAKKIAEENPEKAESLDLGFKTYYLRATDKQTLDKIVDFDPNMPLDVEDIKSKFGKDTIIETWKIKDGYGFNAEVKEIDLKGYTAYLLTDSKVGTSLYLIDDMPDNAIVELVRKIEAYELNVDRIIEYGYAFSHATNTALRSNLKTLKNRNAIEPIIRY
ncbi:MAG: site-specific DNA-methyltransferase, partial [Clostridiales bacterium]|nr:site-specific DNA-methyltransferase [Clostridiales bacterium]